MEKGFKSDFGSLRSAYSTVVFAISNDLTFWNTFLPAAIQAHREKYPDQIRFFESGLCAYDISLESNNGWLHTLDHIEAIDNENLDHSRQRFFQWIQVLSIVRIYNALELLLYGIIETCYLGSLGEKMPLKKLKTLVLTELKNAKIPHDTKNNHFLITYLRQRNSNLGRFFSLPVSNLTTSREEFFEFLSVVRHILVHDEMLVSRNNQNLLKSRFKEFSDLYLQFEPVDRKALKMLFNEKKSGMINLFSQCNDIAYNTLKFAFDLESISA